jgi:hypothetical protein
LAEVLEVGIRELVVGVWLDGGGGGAFEDVEVFAGFGGGDAGDFGADAEGLEDRGGADGLEAEGELAFDVRGQGFAGGEDFFGESLLLEFHLSGERHAAEEGRLGGAEAEEFLPQESGAGGGGCNKYSDAYEQREAGGDGEVKFHSSG